MDSGRKLSRVALILAWLICLGQLVYFYPRLPAELPAHFNGAGVATSYAAREVVCGIYVGATLLIMLMFLGLGSSLSRGSDRRINLPNKAYWLAPERRAQTLAELGHRFHWLGVATLALFFDMFNQIFRVCLGEGTTLDHPRWSIGLFVGFTVIWLIALSRRFRLPSA